MSILRKLFPGVRGERELGLSGQPQISAEHFLQYTKNYLNKGLAVWGLGDEQQVVELHQLLRQSLLITSEDRKKRLNSLIRTAVEANEANTIEPVIITPNRNSWLEVVNNGDSRHFSSWQGVFSPQQREAQEVIMDLTGIVEQRRSGRNSGRTFLLAIDELHEFAGRQLDGDIANNLRWLIKEGPNADVLTVATADRDQLESANTKLLNSFPALFHADGI